MRMMTKKMFDEMRSIEICSVNLGDSVRDYWNEGA